MMGPRLRKLSLIVHVGSSVGWLGAVFGFFVLAVIAFDSADVARARAHYLSMDSLAWLTILPACLAALVSGLWCSPSERRGASCSTGGW